MNIIKLPNYALDEKDRQVQDHLSRNNYFRNGRRGRNMIKDEKPYVTHNKKEYLCYLAGYLNPVQHKWSFVIDGIDSDIRYGEVIKFMGMKLRVCFTCRREAELTKMFNNLSGNETYFEAWK